MELIIQIMALAAVLALIVWMIYRIYDDPYSEYGKLLDEIPDSYSHLSDKALKEEIAKAKKVLHRLEVELSGLSDFKRARRHRIRKKIAAIKLALLHNEQSNRQNKARF